MTPMNSPERLHNQGDKEQVMTPELKFSMELRVKCEQLLKERGKTIIDSEELALHGFTLFGIPLGLIKNIRTKTNPLDLVRHRRIKLKKSGNSTKTIQIDCSGVDPTNAKFIDIRGLEEGYDTWLRLYRNQGARFMGYKAGTGIHIVPIEVRPAFGAELVYYGHQIKQSSSIEHK